MQSVRVLHNFQLSLPLLIQSPEANINCSDAHSTYFGFTYSTSDLNAEQILDQIIFVVQFYCEGDNTKYEEKQCLEWAKKSIICERENGAITRLILRVRIKEGVFDFRKKKLQTGRIIVVGYTASGAKMAEFFTDLFTICIKTSKSVDHEVTIPLHSNAAIEQRPDLVTNESSPSYVDDSEPSHDSEQLESHHSERLFSMEEDYAVLHFGNAEVVGNFRALNFYKASDRRVKRDIERIHAATCRQTMLCIEGVQYRFKDSFARTQQRFIGYIAQQVQQYVPEAVKYINGILHVDYEALIPYISESMRQNYHDINHLEDDVHQLHSLIDHLYEQFQHLEAKAQQHDVLLTKDILEYPKKSNTLIRPIVGIAVTALLAMSVLVAIFFFDYPSSNRVPFGNLTQATVPNLEKEYLIEFFNTTNGFGWKKNDSWLSSDSVCYWYGVVCNAENRTVFLSLPRNGLYGTIPAAISHLSQLTHLDLSTNNLYGIVPNELGQIQSLQSINLATNKLSGPIPVSLAQLHQLEELNLADNQLLSSIPTELGQLTNLKSLVLSYNQLVNTIPVSIGSLKALEWLSLDSNRLGGMIPASLGQLKNLTGLILSNNPLMSTIPPVLFQVPSLQRIAIQNSQLVGTLPDFGPMVNLIAFSLGGNQLIGTIPSSLSNLINLHILDLQYNRLYGTIPDLTALENIEEIYLASNQLAGFLPQIPVNNLITLDVSFNQLSGAIPSFLSNAGALTWLHMQNNSFCAVAITNQPAQIQQCQLDSNPLCCPIPKWTEVKCKASCK